MGKGAVQKCKSTGQLMVRVRQEVSRAGLGGSSVDVKGPTPGLKATNAAGVAEFTGLTPGNYTVTIALSAMSTAKKYKLVSYGRQVGVACGAHSMLEAFARPPSTLRVKVIARRPVGGGRGDAEEVLSGIPISVTGPEPHAGSTAADGTITFADIDSGAYHVVAKNLGSLHGKYTLPAPGGDTLPAGESRQVVLVAQLLASLRFVVSGNDGSPVKGARWTLESPLPAHGTTSADGLIDVPIVPLVRGAGVLRVTLPKPWVAAKKPAAAHAVTPAPAIPPYPPPIKAADFKDAALVNDPPTETFEWDLSIGLLADYTDDNGVKARLSNLGFKSLGLTGAALARVVKAYQKAHMNNNAGSGVLADIKGHVIGLHDNP